jgi:hypothetical protein
MMTMQKALITSRDPKGIHATGLFEAVYNQAQLDDDRAQRLNENGGALQDDIRKAIEKHSATNQFASEEVASSYVYPSEYKGPKPIEEQIKAIAEIFELDPTEALQYAKNLPELPNGAEGWFAIPAVEAIALKHFPEGTDRDEKYCRAIQLIHAKIAAMRSFYNYRDGQITPAQLRLLARTAQALEKIAETQKGGILIIAAQLGMRHRGRSVRRAREVFVTNEFGLGSVAFGAIVLTHPERFVRWEQLHADMAGDEFRDSGADGDFDRAPFFSFYDDRVEFGTYGVGLTDDFYGSASGFLPQ